MSYLSYLAEFLGEIRCTVSIVLYSATRYSLSAFILNVNKVNEVQHFVVLLG